MARTAINVYSVRELEESVPKVLNRVAEAGYDGVQFSGRHTPLEGDPEKIAAVLKETGLDVTPAHVNMNDLQDHRKKMLSTYEMVGVEDVAVPYLPATNFESVAAVEETATYLADLSDELNKTGWGLHYHNHEHEFVDLGNGLTGFEALIDKTNIGIELDVGWALYAGHDPIELIEEYGDRMELIHMKDVDTSAPRDKCFREIGKGDVDMRGCAKAAREAGAEWLIYEHDDPNDPLASITNGVKYLNTL
ncbi:sugar phosphate isomerase/epimerase family protein [Haladaptatus halobius]|uniref:sugar phosphate isomerase/epimerase family protein n=1 Tax=Haladaptatus halobius TaxID=2884875 RepID=UPI001D0BD836|nr:sugar phosphate isomerase/epimerase [Haladaptatus halobius]